MKQYWNDRYQQAEYAYGETPNLFFAEKIAQLPIGKILLPAEGEGRNAVAAARLGWQVCAFDLSEAGQAKANQLAKKYDVRIDYLVSDGVTLPTYTDESFDALGLIYAHFPADVKSDYHRTLAKAVKMGGMVIFEAFGKRHLVHREKNPSVGGPQDLAMLFSVEEIAADFANFDILELAETLVSLSEGAYHQGEGSVVRFVGVRRQ